MRKQGSDEDQMQPIRRAEGPSLCCCSRVHGNCCSGMHRDVGALIQSDSENKGLSSWGGEDRRIG